MLTLGAETKSTPDAHAPLNGALACPGVGVRRSSPPSPISSSGDGRLRATPNSVSLTEPDEELESPSSLCLLLCPFVSGTTDAEMLDGEGGTTVTCGPETLLLAGEGDRAAVTCTRGGNGGSGGGRSDDGVDAWDDGPDGSVTARSREALGVPPGDVFASDDCLREPSLLKNLDMACTVQLCRLPSTSTPSLCSLIIAIALPRVGLGQ